MVGCIIAKLLMTWIDFTTFLKHKRHAFVIANLTVSLDVEEKARAKDVRGKKIVDVSSSAHVVQKNPQNSHKKKFKQDLKQKTTTPFKKKNKEKGNCYTSGKPRHYAKDCEESKWRPKKKSANMIEVDEETSGYGNFLPIVLSVYHSPLMG